MGKGAVETVAIVLKVGGVGDEEGVQSFEGGREAGRPSTFVVGFYIALFACTRLERGWMRMAM